LTLKVSRCVEAQLIMIRLNTRRRKPDKKRIKLSQMFGDCLAVTKDMVRRIGASEVPVKAV
jgi:hypothetical protein